MPDENKTPAPELSRRDFLQQIGAAGMAMGAAPLLVSCGGGSEGASIGPDRESRTYYFNLSNAQANARYVVEAGLAQHPLVPANSGHLEAARRDNPAVEVGSITHVAESISLPGNSPQLCFVKGLDLARPGEWHMHSMFMHLPTSGPVAANCMACNPAVAVRRTKAITGALPPQAASTTTGTNVCNNWPAYVDYFNSAAAMIMSHPEILSFDYPTATYIQNNIVCNDINTQTLAIALYQQGVATTTGGWATLVPVIDPATNAPLIDDTTGLVVYHTIYSDRTMLALGAAVRSVLPVVKNDPNLGANITNLPKDTLNDAVTGKVWVIRNGMSAVSGASAPPLSVSAMRPLAAGVSSTLQFTAKDIEPSKGCAINYISNDGRTITFTVENWYLRYLGLYARFLDGNGQPIPLSSLDSDTMAQFKAPSLNGSTDAFMGLVNQETVVLAIPVKTATQTFTLTLPDAAASVVLMAGGLGHGTQKYPDTILPGMVMTAVLDIALPSLFLIMGGAIGIAQLSESLSTAGALLGQVAQFFITAMTDAGLIGSFGDPSTFMNLIPQMGVMLLTMVRAGAASEIAQFVTWVRNALNMGESVSKIPLVGTCLLVVASALTGAQIIETAVEVGKSAWTLAREVVATHAMTVTVNCDPTDVAGFPQTATQYSLSAVCDGASPVNSGWLPLATPNVTSLTYTFPTLPAGGMVTITAHFASANGTLTGAGTTGPVDNTIDTASITITEILIPLTSSTQYSHKQKTVLDANGNHVWQATTTRPPAPALACGNSVGNLCELVGITLSEHFGALGYGWRASSSSVTEFLTGATGQLYQFANIGFTPDPQKAFMFSGSGFPQPARLAYDRGATVSDHAFYVDTSGGTNIVRRINMVDVDVPPTFDAPGSNMAVGRFNYKPDAFLIHSTGKLISINAAASQMEVLDPPNESPVDDASANIAIPASGFGSRPGLLNGPVCATISNGYVLIVEQGNNRIQALDTGGNPCNIFAGNTSPFIALKERASVTYLDITAEKMGYLYLLVDDGTLGVFAMDIYGPDGTFITTTNDVRASRLAVDLFRNTYLLNFEQLVSATRVEPSVSQWIPST